MIKQWILSLLCLLWAGQTVLAGELRERVYLQTDKQFYLSGELVWMKFIATDLDQRLSDVSKVGYVELLDSASAVVQARLVLEKGVGNGCLQLPSTLPTGNYRLVAYTRYMRNEGEEVFFEKPLTVVNTFVTNEALLTDTLLPTYSFTRREGPVSVLRPRKLLLHKKEIDKIFGKMKEKGNTVVPLQVYFNGSLVKVEVGLAKGKKLYDKRDDIAKKDQKREAQREFKIRNL